MKKNLSVLLIILAVVIIAGIFYASMKKPAQNVEMMQENIPAMNSDSEMQNTEDGKMTEEASRYIVYSPDTFEELSNRTRVLFFYANWCPTCRPADVNFRENSGKIPEDTALIRVNYNDNDTDDSEKNLATKYNITYQHTFVLIDKNDNVIKKWNGGQIEELLKNLQ